MLTHWKSLTINTMCRWKKIDAFTSALEHISTMLSKWQGQNREEKRETNLNIQKSQYMTSREELNKGKNVRSLIFHETFRFRIKWFNKQNDCNEFGLFSLFDLKTFLLFLSVTKIMFFKCFICFSSPANT